MPKAFNDFQAIARAVRNIIKRTNNKKPLPDSITFSEATGLAGTVLGAGTLAFGGMSWYSNPEVQEMFQDQSIKKQTGLVFIGDNAPCERMLYHSIVRLHRQGRLQGLEINEVIRLFTKMGEDGHLFFSHEATCNLESYGATSSNFNATILDDFVLQRALVFSERADFLKNLEREQKETASMPIQKDTKLNTNSLDVLLRSEDLDYAKHIINLPEEDPKKY